MKHIKRLGLASVVIVVVLLLVLLVNKLGLTSRGQSIELVSEIPGYSISFTSEGRKEYSDYLNKYNILSEGVLHKVNSLEEVKVHPVSQVKVIITPNLQEKFQVQGIQQLASLGQTYDAESKILALYINPTEYAFQVFSAQELNSFISSLVLQATYFSDLYPDMNVVPERLNQDMELKAIDTTYREANKTFVEINKKTTHQVVESFLDLISNEANASHCGGYTYKTGAAQNIYRCSGGTKAGQPCTTTADCTPGGTCAATWQCVLSGGTSACVTLNLVGGGHACEPGNLGNCDAQACPSTPVGGTTPPPPGPPAPPPAGSWGACGGCSGCTGGVTSQCRINPSGSCVWDPSGCGGGAPPPAPPPVPPPPPQQGTCSFGAAGPWTFPSDTLNHSIQIPLSATGLPDKVNLVAANNLSPNRFQWAPVEDTTRSASGYYDFGIAPGTITGGVWQPVSPGTVTFTARGIYGVDIHCSRTYSFTITGGSPPPPPAGPVVNLTANGSGGPVSVTSGSAVTLAWSTSNASSCTASASVATSAWSGSKATSGSISSGGLTSSRTFTLNCTGPGGSGSDSVTVNITTSPPPPSAPTVNLTANGSGGPVSVVTGSAVTLAWSTTNASSCTASASVATSAWSGSKATSGSISSGALTSSRTFTLNCTGSGGSGSDSVTVNITTSPPPPSAPTVDLRVNSGNGPISVTSGTSTTLSWSTTNASSCTASVSVTTSGWSGSKATSGSQSSGAITSSRTFTLNCTGSGGSASDSVTVNIAAATPTPAPSCTFGGWTSGACRAGGCGNGQRLQTRTANPTSCSPTSQCVNDNACLLPTATPVPTAPPSNLTASLTANPSGGAAPFNAGFTASAGGSATGTITYQFDCTNDGLSDYTVSNSSANPLTTGNICTYPSAGTYTAQLRVGRAGLFAFATRSITVTAPTPPPAAPVVNLTANGSGGPVSVTSGSAVTLAWSTTNATSCTASATVTTTGWSGSKAVSGSQSSGAITSSRTFTLNCTGPGGSRSDTVTVNVSASTPAPTPTPPTVDLRANTSNGPLTVANNSSVNLSWSSTNATSCTASNAWTGSKAVSGSQSSGAITSNRTYTLTCTGTGGSRNDSVVVNVTGAPTCTITSPVNPLNVNVGQTTTMNPTITTSNGGILQSVTYSTSSTNFAINPPTTVASTPYTVTVRGLTAASGTLTMQGTLTTGQTCIGTTTVSSAAAACSIPRPRDPADMACPTSITSTDGSITWAWEPVINATQYQVIIRRDNPTTGTIIAQSGWQNSATFGASCLVTAGVPLCTFNTPNLAAAQYFSTIQAQGAVCGPSLWSAPELVDLLSCISDPWWQAGIGDVIANQNITSEIPDSATELVTDNSAGIPGIVIYGGNIINTGNGVISTKSWAANSLYRSPLPDYQTFNKLAPAGTNFTDPGGNPTGNSFTSGGTTDGNGYVWYKHTGDMTITSDMLIPSGRKVIVFVEAGNATLNGRIQFSNRQNSFFMLVVGAPGQIRVSPTLTTAIGTPTLEGIFMAPSMVTGAGSVPLTVRGTVAVTNGITLERDLGAGNATSSAETFIFSPELMYNYPTALTIKRISWQEIAP